MPVPYESGSSPPGGLDGQPVCSVGQSDRLPFLDHAYPHARGLTGLRPYARVLEHQTALRLDSESLCHQQEGIRVGFVQLHIVGGHHHGK